MLRLGGGQGGGVRVVGLGDHQDVRGRLGVDVAEGDGRLGLADDGRRHLPRDDLAEQAVGLPVLPPWLRVSSSVGRCPWSLPYGGLLSAPGAWPAIRTSGRAAQEQRAAAVPAVEVRRRSGRAGTARPRVREDRQLLRGDAPFGADDEHDDPGAGQLSRGQGLAALLVQDGREVGSRQQRGTSLVVIALRDLGEASRRDCLPASRAVDRHLPAPSRPRSPFHRVMQRAACQGTIASTPVSVIVSTATSPRSPLGSAWTTVMRGRGSAPRPYAGDRDVQPVLALDRLHGPVRPVPAPSVRTTASPARSRFTETAWRPSGPSSATVARPRATSGVDHEHRGGHDAFPRVNEARAASSSSARTSTSCPAGRSRAIRCP